MSSLDDSKPIHSQHSAGIMVGIFSAREALMDDRTERTRIRQSVRQHKVVLTICALVAIVGIVGWLTTL